MLRIKNILPVFVVLLFLGVASTAFAQVSCNVASTPVSRDSATGLTEPAGDITFTCTQGGSNPSTAGATISVSYGITITNDTNTPAVGQGYLASKPIAVGVQVSGTAVCPAVTGVSVSNTTGQVVITMGSVAPGTTLGNSCSYTLTGVLLGIAGSGATSVVATVSVSPGNNLLITAGQNTPTVVTSVLSPLVTVTGTTLGPGVVPTTGVSTSFSTVFSIAVTENYIDMFRDSTTFNSGASSNGVQLLFTFAGIPTGAQIQNCAMLATSGVTTGISSTTATPAAPTITLTVGAGINLSAIDKITLKCGLSAADVGGPATSFATGATTTLPLAAGSITVTVSLAPIGTALSATNAVLNSPTTTGQIPRYTGPSFGPFNVINIIPLTTHMIFPFVSVGNGFDTGLVIANTTADPYGGTKFGGAAAAAGPVTVAFYPSSGTPFCVSTGAGAATVAGIASCTTVTAGAGLTSGTIASGGSWTVLLSAIVAQVTGAPTAFSGYGFGIANFPFAHPTAFVADAAFSGKFAAGGPALVLQNPAVTGRNAFPTGGLAESLGH